MLPRLRMYSQILTTQVLGSVKLEWIVAYWNLSSAQAQAITNILKSMRELPITTKQCERAIALRQDKKMSLGDALIAATALEYELSLATRNTKDFNLIPICL